MFRFLLTVMVVGLVVGFVRRTWLHELPEASESPEAMAEKVAAVAQEKRDRYLGTSQVTEASWGNKVNLNSATTLQLATLPGVGPALAERIVAHRQESGPFESVDDLMKVRGIGEKTVERIRNYVTLEGPDTGSNSKTEE